MALRLIFSCSLSLGAPEPPGLPTLKGLPIIRFCGLICVSSDILLARVTLFIFSWNTDIGGFFFLCCVVIHVSCLIQYKDLLLLLRGHLPHNEILRYHFFYYQQTKSSFQ